MGRVYCVWLETTAQSCAVTRSTSKLAKRSDRYRQSRRLHSARNWNAVSFLQRAVHPLEINNGWWHRRAYANFSKSTRGYCFRLTIGEFFNPRARLVALQADHSIFRRLLAAYAAQFCWRAPSKFTRVTLLSAINLNAVPPHNSTSCITVLYTRMLRFPERKRLAGIEEWISNKHCTCSPLLFRDAIASFISRESVFAMTASRDEKWASARDGNRSKPASQPPSEESKAMDQWQSRTRWSILFLPAGTARQFTNGRLRFR